MLYACRGVRIVLLLRVRLVTRNINYAPSPAYTRIVRDLVLYTRTVNVDSINVGCERRYAPNEYSLMVIRLSAMGRVLS